jgi:hypothetical protein
MKTSVVRWALLVFALAPGFSVAQCPGTVVPFQTTCACTGAKVDTTTCGNGSGVCSVRFNAFYCDSGQLCGVGAAQRICLRDSAWREDQASSIPTCGGAPLFSPRKWVDIDSQDRLSIADFREEHIQGK